MKSTHSSTRRTFLRTSLAMGAGGLFSGGGLTSTHPVSAAEAAEKQRALRLAHITDIHVQPERGAVEGMTAALQHLQELNDPPQLIINGGDAVMDTLATDTARTELQWKLWNNTLRDECSLPVEHCIGNHDVWGWDKKPSGTSGKEANWGKQRALDAYQLPKRYRSFDQNGWHFVVLDSVFPDQEDTYIACLDKEQFAWLVDDLTTCDPNKPVIIVSHIPILSVAYIEFAAELAAKPSRIRCAVHTDAKQIVDLLKQHPNVKLCISGHLHLFERLEYSGVTYLCNGAVSGYWWKGDHATTDEGYAVIDLYEDGSFDQQYISYGWQPK